MTVDPLSSLRPRLSPLVGPELDALWSSFRKRYPDGDIGLFLARLRRAGRLTDEQVTRLLLSEEVTITLSEAGAPPPRSGGRRWGELGKLGEGAMGEVWLATDPALRRQVAVKRLRAELADHPDLVRRFRAEAQITAQLDHPGILPIYGLAMREDGQIEYAMRLIRGRTLDDVLQQARVAHKERSIHEDLALPARLELFLHVCDAMAYAHQRGVLHRDLKPENIMVGSFHEVTVMDWGISKLVQAEDEELAVQLSEDKANRTQLGMAIGTPAYMSPEQARGENATLDPRSDQYALGLILQEIITLRRAISGKTVHEILYRAQEGERDPVKAYSKLEPVPRPLRAILDKACALAPADRYATVEDLGDDVRRYLRDESIAAAPDSILGRIHRWVGRHRTFMINAVLGVALLSLLGFILTVGAALALFELDRSIGAERQQAAQRVLGRVAVQGQKIDGVLLEYEGLVHGAAYSVEQALAAPPVDIPIYTEDAFLDPRRAPPDLGWQEHYHADVSLDHPILKLAPGVSEDDVHGRLLQLASVQPRFWQVMLESERRGLIYSDAEAQRFVIGETGVPVVWVIAAIEEGIIVGVPGKAGYPDGYDPRERSWYRGAVGADGVFWDEPYVDASGMGLLVSCALAVRDSEGRIVGVASLDLDIDRLASELLAADDLRVPDAEAYLVDTKGTIKLRSSLSSGDVSRAGAEKLDLHLWEAVVEHDAATGLVEVDGEMVAWVHLAATGWIYMVRGDKASLLRGPGEYTGW